MSGTSEKPQVDLSAMTPPIVTFNGIKVEFNANGGLDVYGNVPVTVHTPANDTAENAIKKELEVGDKMEDGTIFAGISPDTGQNMFVPPQDLSGTFNWKAGKKAAETLEAHGHNDYTLPSQAELDVLYQNRDKIGGFNQSGSTHAGWYWSSTQYDGFNAWQQRFSDGYHIWDDKVDDVSVRPVRAELRPS